MVAAKACGQRPRAIATKGSFSPAAGRLPSVTRTTVASGGRSPSNKTVNPDARRPETKSAQEAGHDTSMRTTGSVAGRKLPPADPELDRLREINAAVRAATPTPAGAPDAR